MLERFVAKIGIENSSTKGTGRGDVGDWRKNKIKINENK